MNRSAMRAATRIAAVLGAALAAAACDADRAATTAPAARLQADQLASEPALMPVLKRTMPLDHAVSASITVDGNGGVLRLPEAGLQVVIPRNALPNSGPVTITVTAVAGDAVAYEFEPHGVVFAQPLAATQELGATSWDGHTGRTTLEAAYFAGAENLDVPNGTARISELFPTLVATGKKLHWDIPHFSGYVIVTGYKKVGG
jgi:hypothetical protein